MIFDSHSHTKFSSDSEMAAEEAIAIAEKLGIGLAFTEHYDYDYLENLNYKNMDFRFDAKEYWQKYESLRSEKLSLGVEIGLVDDTSKENKEFIAQAPFDMVIGSIHNIDRWDLYYPNFYEGKDKNAAFNQYLSVMAQLIEKNPYIDVLGHIDYISRYAPFANKELNFVEFQSAIEKVLKNAIENEVVMELNTRRLGDINVLKALAPTYKLYAELGGRYITLGSDAHVKENIGMNFKAAQDFANELGLTVVTFRERKMIKA